MSYSQARNSNGFPIDSEPFTLQTALVQHELSDSGFGRSVTLARVSSNWYLYACGSSKCEFFYQVIPGPLDLPSTFSWSSTGPLDPGNSAAFSPFGYFGVSGADNKVRIIDRVPSGDQTWTFNPPLAGSSFNGSITGGSNVFLTGVTLSGNSQLRSYGLSGSSWAPLAGPIATFNGTPQLGTTMAVNSDTWLVSNTNSQGTAASSAFVYRMKLNRNNTFNTFTDDTWTSEQVATGGSKFGGALAITPGFFVLGDPSLNAAYAFGNDQTLSTNPFPSTTSTGGTGTVVIRLTQVSGSPPPVVKEVDNCSSIANSLIAGQPTGPCIDVTANEFIGTAQVCYPNPTHRGDIDIFRCTAPNVATTPPTCTPPATFMSDLGKCCQQLDFVAANTADPLCAVTSGFSEIVAGVARDRDGDGRADLEDNCPLVQNFFQPDGDSDLVGNACDNCAAVANFDQLDYDHDGLGNACDPTPGSAPAPSSVPLGIPIAGLGALLLGLGASRLRRRSQDKLQA